MVHRTIFRWFKDYLIRMTKKDTKHFCETHFESLKKNEPRVFDRVVRAVDQICNVESFKTYEGRKLVEFDVLRNVMYHWSKRFEEEFFKSAKELSFLFRWWLFRDDFTEFCDQMLNDKKLTYKQAEARRTLDEMLEPIRGMRERTAKSLAGHIYLHYVKS